MDADKTRASVAFHLCSSASICGSNRMNAIVPIPKCDVAIRVATMADLPRLDALQKQYNQALGYFPTKQFEGYIQMGGVLVAEAEDGNERLGLGLRLGLRPDQAHHNLNPNRNLNRPSASSLLGYIISRDRYLKRDELGVIYQLCVAPEAQRSLVGASLVKAAFERAAYGCRLFCCWCAQDLAANRFWESMGFVPVAFRAGSTGKRRVHIFWQRRTSADDTTTPWWYPSQTNSGAMREDRLVFPIPPGTHWSEVQAIKVPSAEMKVLSAESQTESKEKVRGKRTQHSALSTQHSKGPLTTSATSLRFGAPPKDAKPKKPREK